MLLSSSHSLSKPLFISRTSISHLAPRLHIQWIEDLRSLTTLPLYLEASVHFLQLNSTSCPLSVCTVDRGSICSSSLLQLLFIFLH
jgi:hypothetical protein